MCSLTGHTPLVRPTSLSQVGTAVWSELTGHSPLSAHNPFTGRHSYLKWSHWSQSSLSACFPFTGRCSCLKWAQWMCFSAVLQCLHSRFSCFSSLVMHGLFLTGFHYAVPLSKDCWAHCYTTHNNVMSMTHHFYIAFALKLGLLFPKTVIG